MKGVLSRMYSLASMGFGASNDGGGGRHRQRGKLGVVAWNRGACLRLLGEVAVDVAKREGKD